MVGVRPAAFSTAAVLLAHGRRAERVGVAADRTERLGHLGRRRWKRQGARHLPVERSRPPVARLGSGERARAASDGAAGQAAAALCGRSADRRHVPTLRRAVARVVRGRLPRRRRFVLDTAELAADAPGRGNAPSPRGVGAAALALARRTARVRRQARLGARRYHHLYGWYSYGGHRSSASASRVRAGRSTHTPATSTSTRNSIYGRGWRREGAFLSQRPNGNFCWVLPARWPAAGHGDRYRATVIGPASCPTCSGSRRRSAPTTARTTRRPTTSSDSSPATPGTAAPIEHASRGSACADPRRANPEGGRFAAARVAPPARL